MTCELIGEVVFKTLEAQMRAVEAWKQIAALHIEMIRGVIRVYKVAEVRP
jgi:hypothetical protein